MTPRSSPTGSVLAMRSAPRRIMLNVPIRLISTILRNRSSGNGPSRPSVLIALPVPAQLTTTRTGPSDSAVSSAALTAASSVTSASADVAPSPSSSTASFPLKSSTTTCAPLPISALAVASPSPDAPPVTTAATSLTSMMSSFLRLDDRRTVRGTERSNSRSNELAADNHSLDLVGALEDLHDLGFSHVPLDGVIACVARTAEDLNGVCCDSHGGVSGHQLGHRSVAGVGQSCVAAPSGVNICRARRVHTGAHLGQQKCQPLMVDYPPAQGATILAVLHRRVERGLGHPNCDRGDPEAPGIECAERDLEALALCADTATGGHEHLVIVRRGRWYAAQPHLFLRWAECQSSGILGHQETGDAARPWGGP